MSELVSQVEGRTGRVSAIYARVSSERQRQDETIQSQTVGLRELAATRGLLVTEDLVFEDEGFSGATLTRPALERLRDRAAEGAFEVLLCHAPDRLARRYAYQVLLLEELARAGVEVCFAKEPERGGSPEDELLRQFQGMIAEYERAQIAERTRRGKLHRANSPSWRRRGPVPRSARESDGKNARAGVGTAGQKRAVGRHPLFPFALVLMTDRVSERRRAVALARHYRDQEGLAIAEIARRLGCAEGTVKAYLYDPTGDKARAVKARYRGVCRGCGAPTAPRNGKGDAYAYCKRCHPGAIAPEWTRERVREAMRAWRARYGAAPSSYDWSRTHARRRGGEALKRLRAGEWPSPSTVIDLYGSWAAAVADAFGGA